MEKKANKEGGEEEEKKNNNESVGKIFPTMCMFLSAEIDSGPHEGHKFLYSCSIT